MSERSKTNEADDLLFLKEEVDDVAVATGNPYKIMIVDDDEEVHKMTRLVLSDCMLDGRGVTFLSAYTGNEAEQVMILHPDVALILLDVVMEKDQAGLDFVRFVRKTLHNSIVRIILRTGQPGQAPEKKVIMDFDINDYKEKTELTSQKLFTAVITALRSFRDLTSLNESKEGLHKIIQATGRLFQPQSLFTLTKGILQQLAALLNFDKDHSSIHASSIAASLQHNDFVILSATGRYTSLVGKKIGEIKSEKIQHRIQQALTSKLSIYADEFFVGYFESSAGIQNIFYLDGFAQLDAIAKDLIEIFSHNVLLAYDNLYLNEEIVATQKSIVFTLGDVIEKRSQETGNHVKRMSDLCCYLAEQSGFEEAEVEILRIASPMHDIGKVAIPDNILQKPGKLTDQEFKVIKTHPGLGYNILHASDRPIMKMAAIIALEHHEKWDGTGYPKGLKGEEISIYGRITGIADVIDALGHERCYKEAWPFEEVMDFVKQQRGKHFDPALVDIVLDHLQEIKEIDFSEE